MLFLPVFLGEDVFLCFRGRKRQENGKKMLFCRCRMKKTVRKCLTSRKNVVSLHRRKPRWRNRQTRWSQTPVDSLPCRFDPGSGYEFDSKAIAKPLKTRGLAIFLSSNFPTFSPHLQEFVQRRPIFPTRKARIRYECQIHCQNEECIIGSQSKTLIVNQQS